MSDRSAPADTLTRWRYWLITPELLRPDKARLLPNDPKDKAVWEHGVTDAVCRHDPTHTPPHPGCTCGIYAIGGADIQFGSALRQVYWTQRVRNIWADLHGSVSPVLNPPPKSPAAMVELVRSHGWRLGRTRAYDPRNQFVIGRVRLNNAVPSAPPPADVWQLKSWRGQSALVEALYIEPSAAMDDVGCDVDELAAALSDRYRVPCEVGYPRYTQEDWDARTIPTAAHVDVPSWRDLGFRPPGVDAPPPRFWTTTLPATGRKHPRVWTATVPAGGGRGGTPLRESGRARPGRTGAPDRRFFTTRRDEYDWRDRR
ncbi:Uncharacterised protein [Mycobacteroides abscessus subsp. abscessus]|uniref:hypothetical protein n=1 Tax=Mycobacteroides abscessus TaxID=36809 RepID=UPI0009271363|nr:hypothetical protein [Mycobacteroides abscessus]SIA00038.1 Uncharacterised protein [Mycobacteroides abscessus subsp. abscessus]SIA00191.1 Uncharacterised protein [Mycobacteroides abscessus subsp. abscessus]